MKCIHKYFQIQRGSTMRRRDVYVTCTYVSIYVYYYMKWQQKMEYGTGISVSTRLLDYSTCVFCVKRLKATITENEKDTNIHCIYLFLHISAYIGFWLYILQVRGPKLKQARKEGILLLSQNRQNNYGITSVSIERKKNPHSDVYLQ